MRPLQLFVLSTQAHLKHSPTQCVCIISSIHIWSAHSSYYSRLQSRPTRSDKALLNIRLSPSNTFLDASKEWILTFEFQAGKLNKYSCIQELSGGLHKSRGERGDCKSLIVCMKCFVVKLWAEHFSFRGCRIFKSRPQGFAFFCSTEQTEPCTSE